MFYTRLSFQCRAEFRESTVLEVMYGVETLAGFEFWCTNVPREFALHNHPRHFALPHCLFLFAVVSSFPSSRPH